MDPQCSIRLDRAARPFYLDFMCGRFTQHLSWAEIHRLADLIGQPRNSRLDLTSRPQRRSRSFGQGRSAMNLYRCVGASSPLGGKSRLASFRRRSTPRPKPSLRSRCSRGVQGAPLHHPSFRLLRVDRQSGRQDAALFLVAVRRAARARGAVGTLAGSGKRRKLRTRRR